MKFRNGFIFKDFSMKNIIFEGVKPTIEEITTFKNAKETMVGSSNNELYEEDWRFLDEENLKSVMLDGNPTHINRKDVIRVIEGDLNGLTGTVTEVSQTHVTFISTDIEEIKNKPLIVDKEFCVKHFKKYD